MKRFGIAILFLLAFLGIYNFSVIKTSFMGLFGDLSYQRADFLNAKKGYETILENFSGSTLLEADTLYNMGNASYRLGEQARDAERIRLWKEAIGNYTKSLAFRIDRDTEENLAFVREKLQKEEQEQAKKDEKKSAENTKSTTGSGKSDPANTSGTKNGEKKDESGTGAIAQKPNETQKSGSEKQNWSNGGSYNSIGGTGAQDTQKDLSDADRTELKNYTEGLKQFEKQNGKLLNPDKSKNIGSVADQIRNFFGNDSFFQDVLPTNDGKKDW